MYPIMKCLMSFKNWLPCFFCAFILWLSEILSRKWFSWIRLLLVHLAFWNLSLHQDIAINTNTWFIIDIKIGKLRHKHFFLLIFFLLVKLFQETCIPSMRLVSNFLAQVIPHHLPQHLIDLVCLQEMQQRSFDWITVPSEVSLESKYEVFLFYAYGVFILIVFSRFGSF